MRQHRFLLVSVIALSMALALSGSLRATNPIHAHAQAHAGPQLVRLSEQEQRQRLIAHFGARAAKVPVYPSSGWQQVTGASYPSYTAKPSDHWSGYTADTSTTGFKTYEVFGGFTVPNWVGNTPSMAGWAGIGGYGGPNLLQAGYASVYLGGVNKVTTFIEDYPNPAYYSPGWTEYAGDIVYVQITPWQDNWANAAQGNWEIAMISNVASADEEITNFFPVLTAADWIVERSPTSSGPLPNNYGPVPVTDAFRVDQYNSGDEPIDSVETGTVVKFTLKDTKGGSNNCLIPTALSPYGTGVASQFTVNWASSSHC